MTTIYQDRIGASVESIDTPFLKLDLDILEKNIRYISSYCREHRCAWRPHSKAHKSPQIAHMQIAAGAIGITCAKLSEAELLVDHGIEHILLANQLVTQAKWNRLGQLQTRSEVIATIEDLDIIPLAAEAARHSGQSIPLLIELDIGMGRVGVEPGDKTLSLAQRIAETEGLSFRGLMGYEGHVLSVQPETAKKKACIEAINYLLSSRDLLAKNGLNAEIISAGGTGSFAYTAAISGITEVQAGGGIFMDAKYRDEFHVSDLQVALTLLASVTSRRPGQVVTDSGFKSMSAHHGSPQACGRNDLELKYLSAEHGVFTMAEDAPLPALGERLEFTLGYTDSTTFLHDVFWGVRNGKVECVLPILGRGLLT
ncbi:MAG: DSD1 family PLP-dependent enzyme [Candidatus Latescibacterota bacterium]|jgi:D-serine deaminase-like pyridoxal phosphate-dependent protein